MDNKSSYRQFCETAGADVPLFLQYWWMETVCAGKEWNVALAKKGDKIEGVMPFLLRRRMGLTYILQPQLTQYSGPHYCYPDGLSASARVAFEHRVGRELLRQMDLHRPIYVLQHCSPKIINWLPFYWEGFSQTTRYTYRLNDISDSSLIFAAFDRDERQKKILRLEAETQVCFDMSPVEFARFHHAYWRSKGQRDLLDEAFIVRICEAAIARRQGVIASLCDSEGRLLAARFVVFDSRCAYSLMSAFEPSRYRNGKTEKLEKGLLQWLADKTKAFDFEGSMDEGIEHFYRSFGAVQTPYFEISRCRRQWFRLLLAMRKGRF